MKCYYEILGIARDADDSDIKTAYRKLALKWHPDKNLDNPDEAKEQFQLVQQAYEVLSDPHERAWYDNHREQILRGRNSDYEDSCLDIFPYFTVSCFKGYGDDPGGFYQVYSDVFERIAAEDAEFIHEEEFEKIPKFGNSKSNYEDEVGPFYAYWQSYCTRKSYAWLCPYNISEIKDRRILREIEKEMKKIVQKAKRERNEEIRNLVSFIRKRDKRVQAYKKYLEEKAAINRQKQEQNRLEQIRKRKQEIEESKKSQNSNLNVDYEERLKLLEQEYDDSDDEYEEYDDSEYDEDNINDEEDNIENSLIESTTDLQLENDDDILTVHVDEFYCVACNRQFKNEKAFQNHEISKKHRENVGKLRKEMIEEEEENQKSDEKLNDLINNEQIEDDEKAKSQNKSKNKKNRKSKRAQNIKGSEDDEEIENNMSNIVQLSDIDDDNWDDNKKSNKKSKGKKTVSQQQQKSSVDNNHVESMNQNVVTTAAAVTTTTVPDKKVASSSKKGNVKEATSNGIDVDVNHVCVTCKSSFESKNKLFQHLKKTNHGVYILKAKPTTTNEVGTTNKKGKRHK